MMKERFDEHHREHHSNVTVQELGPELMSESSSTSRDREMSASSMDSCSAPYVCLKSKESHSAQTEVNPTKKPIFQDYGHGPINSNDILNKRKLNEPKSNNIALKSTETREVLTPKHDFYKEYVRNETIKWMKKLPMYAETDAANEMLRDNVINALIEDICTISENINHKNYDENLKLEIDKSVNELPMWMPGDKREQGPFKDKFTADLFNTIKKLNNRLFKEDKPSNSKNRSIHFKDTTEENTTDNTRFLADIDIRIIENEIKEWLSNIKIEKDLFGNNIRADEIQQLLLNNLEYLLKEPKVAAHYKFTLKGEILDVLKKLPIAIKRPASKMVYLYRLAEELANRLLCVQARHAKHRFNEVQNVMLQQRVHEIMNLETPANFKYNIFTVISECLENMGINPNKEIEKEISDVLKRLESTDNGLNQNSVNEVAGILQNYCDVSPNKAMDIASNIIASVRYVIYNNPKDYNARNITKPRLSGIISVYTSEERNTMPSYPITSTPKRVTIPRSEIPRQSPEEINLIIYIAEAIDQWMDTIPDLYHRSEDRGFREAIINELAAAVVETLRNLQLTPSLQSENAVATTISDWLVKFRIFVDYEQHLDEIKDLFGRIFERLQRVPVLTRPQHGNRQAIGHLKYREEESHIEYVPKGIDILEDEISIWMNEQPADAYLNNDRSLRGKMIHELAENVQAHLVNKRPEREIENDVRQWLNSVLSPTARPYLSEMTGELKERLKHLPQDATLGKAHIERMKDLMERQLAKANAVKEPHDETIIEKTMKDFIQKFIQQYYVVDDPVARRALTRVLKQELMKLKPPTRKEVYDNFAKSEPNALFAPQIFVQELEYIKLLADWLKSIPIDPNYKALGNKDRVNFIQYVAKYITAIENERSRAPGAMNYDLHLANIIMSYLNTLPIPNEQKVNMARMIDQILAKLSAYKESIQQKARQAPIVDDLGEFIGEYVRKYGEDVYDNEIKLEVWSDRLMNEIQKIVHETSNPAELTQNQVYNRLAHVPLPFDDTVESFVLEMNYITEIVEWMKNLPLAPITSKEDGEHRVEMVSDLAEKLFERKIKKTLDPNDKKADADAVEYISSWISRLELEPRHEIVVPVLIHQLLNRVDKAKADESWDVSISDVTRSTNMGVIRPEPKPRVSMLKNKDYINKPEALIVDTVEKFCNALPIRGENQEVVKSTKDEIKKKVLQKTGELNIDPAVFNNPPLYRDVFTDEVNDIVKEAPLNPDAAKNIEKLKEDLIETIIDANAAIKEKSAGEEYKQNLENVINTSIPSPARKEPMPEPGFEMYKNRLVNMFILENFDHSSEEMKLTYEKQIRAEIDRYFQCAQNKSAIPLTKDQIYNELYSALFKVPIPNEAAVIDEAEIVKTRCEIDKWFEELPLREATNLNEQLEWDLKLATIAKKIHEIEKYEQNSQDKILKEIKKWLPRLPLLPGKESRYDEFANKLQNALKSTAESRKCVITKPRKGGKVKGKKSKEQVKPTTAAAATGRSSFLAPKPAVPCCRTPNTPKGKPADLLLETVAEWCRQLPLMGNTVEEIERHKDFREEIFTRIVMKLTELNADQEIFVNDFMYNEMLDDELENILNMIPTSYDAQQSKEARKQLLKQQIASIKMLIKKDKNRHNYKDALKQTVVSILEPPVNTTADKMALFDNLVEEIVEDFVQLHYNRNDEEGRQLYKSKVQEAVLKQFYEIQSQPETEPTVNPMFKINQLLCELAKVPIPDPDTLKDEVEEIKMREQVDEFFEQVPFPDQKEENINHRNQVKLSLAKHLADIEKNGHNCSNDNKMRSEIARHLKKVNVEVMPQVIDAFVEKLKNNEAERKAPPPEDFDLSQINAEFNAIGLRTFRRIRQPHFSGTDMDGSRFSIEALARAPEMFSGAGFTPPRPPARLDIPGPHQPASGEPLGPTPRSRVGFTPQPTTHLISRPAAPGEEAGTSDEEDRRCKCGGRRMKLGARRPTCILRRNSEDGREYCEPMPHMWRRPPFGGFLYY
ncbi:hypothetical protein O3G_MSEX007245 [Manduca sexta]|nr:hypothetical protein O3G_MSEX007245 [Manduca sexta]